MLAQFFDKIKLHQYFLYTHLFVRCLGDLELRVLIQVYFGVLHSQGFKVWAGNWLFLVPVWVLRPQSYQEASSLRGLVVGGERQLKAGLSCEVTIEHTEHVGGLFSSVWDRGGPGIRGVTIWSSRSSKGSSQVTRVVRVFQLQNRVRRA